MVKSPFERIFSKLDRKKLFQKFIKTKKSIYLKNSSQQIFQFIPYQIDEDLTLRGKIKGGEPGSGESKVTCLFYVDSDRYFMSTKLKFHRGEWKLSPEHNCYLLNRRTAFRTKIPAGANVQFFVSSIRNIEILLNCQVLEISSGGARIFWPHTKKIGSGAVLKGVIQWNREKMIPVSASVVHRIEDEIYGIKFVNLTPLIQNRLRHLSVELQMQFAN